MHTSPSAMDKQEAPERGKKSESRLIVLPAIVGALLSLIVLAAKTRSKRPQLTHLLSRHAPLAPSGHKFVLGADNTTFDNPWPSWTGTASVKDILGLLFSREYLYSLLPTSTCIPVDKPYFPPCTPSLQATWLGHAGLFVQQSNFSYLVDPLLSHHVTPIPPFGPPRISLPPFESYAALASASRIASLDFVLLSHSHYDHLSIPDLVEIESLWSPHYYVPYGLDRYLTCRPLNIPASRVTQLVWWEHASHPALSGQATAEIILTPAQHWSRRGFFDKNLALHGGFAVRTETSKAYFVGDSGYTPILFNKIGELLGPFDFSAIPIGAYAPRNVHRSTHMDPEEAMTVHRQVRSRSSIAIHWGTFRLTVEPVLEPCQILSELLMREEIDDKSKILKGNSLADSNATGLLQARLDENDDVANDRFPFRCIRPGQVVSYLP